MKIKPYKFISRVLVTIICIVLIGLLSFFIVENKDKSNNLNNSPGYEQTQIYEQMQQVLEDYKNQLTVCIEKLDTTQNELTNKTIELQKCSLRVTELEGCEVELEQKNIELQQCNERIAELEQNAEENASEIANIKQQVETISQSIEMLQVQFAELTTIKETITILNADIENINETITSLEEKINNLTTQIDELCLKINRPKFRQSGNLKNDFSVKGQAWKSLGVVEFDLAEDADVFMFCDVYCKLDWGSVHVAIFVDDVNLRQATGNNTSLTSIINPIVKNLTQGHHVVEFKIRTDNDTNTVTVPNYMLNSYTIIEL